MKILLNHSFPEKKEAFSSDEANYILENLKDWTIVSFSKYKIKKKNVVYLSLYKGIFSYFFCSKVSITKKIKILKKVLNGDFKNILRNTQSLLLAFSFIQKFQKEDIELIYSYWFTRPTIIAYYLNYLIEVKFIMHGHGSDIYIYPPKNIGEIIKKSSGVMTVAKANKEYIKSKYDVEDKKIRNFKLGVKNPKDIKFIEYKDRSNKIVYIGRFEKVKGIDILMETLKNIKKNLLEKKYFVEIYGEGRLESYIRKVIKENNLEDIVTLKGWLNQKEILEKIGESKLLLLSSYSEGLPIILMQAISMGTPIIANDVGGVNEIVSEETGILNKNLSVSGFEKSIIDFLNLENEIKIKMSNNGIKLYSKDYCLEENLRKKFLWLENQC